MLGSQRRHSGNAETRKGLEMFTSVRMFAGAAAFVLPVAMGVVYTGGTSITGGDGFDFGSTQTEDEFVVEHDGGGQYNIDRRQDGDIVTIVVTGPDGNVIQPTDFPEYVAEDVAELESPDWQPNDIDLWDSVDGTPCYDADALNAELARDGGFGVTSSSPEGLFALEAYEDGTVDAAYFEDENAFGHDGLDALRESGAVYLDLEGAQPLNACEG